MKVRDFIKELEKYDPELIVTLADWGEQYLSDSEIAASLISIQDWGYYASDNVEKEPHLVIGFAEPESRDQPKIQQLNENPYDI